MRLSRLNLFGFKTFAGQTKVEFHPGITAIVGPNGSGKSNLVDAIRWVLGEQSTRSLRSQKLEDVIFAGNTMRKPLGMAEVSLTFDNTSRRLPIAFDEVQITRRAYRAGESEYFINRTPVRLRDVHELMMGTGLGPGSYAIVSQGQIDAILSSKPGERRALFEETAGIGKFLARKAEALRRLEGTETNAIRVNDLIAELERRIPELDTQARRARRYRKASARLRDLEILSYVRASTSRRAERERVTGALREIDERRTIAAARAAALGAQVAAERNALYTRELALEERRAQAQEARSDLARVEADASGARARLEALQAQLSGAEEVRERTASERESLAAALDDLEAGVEPLRAVLAELEEREREAAQATADARRALESVYAALRSVEAVAAERAASEAERRAMIDAARGELTRLEGELVQATADAQRAAREAAADRERYAELERACDEDERLLDAERVAMEEAKADADAAGAELERLRARHRELSGEIAAAQSRLHTIEELETALEGHVPGTRAIVEASARGQLGGIHGVVSNLINVDESYARALDVAFGAGLSNIVTETSEDAERAIALLREGELGRATFLPLDTLADRRGRELGALGRRAGIIGYAHTLVTCEERYRGIVAFLVGRILIVDVLATAIGLVRGEGFRDSIVTLEGEQVLGGGAITGGRSRKERSILARRAQARALRDALPVLRDELAAVDAEGLQTQGALQRAAAERERARSAQSAIELRLRDARTRMTALASEIERLDGEERASTERAERGHASLAETAERISMLERVESAGGDIERDRERLERELGEVRERIAEREGVERSVAGEARERRDALAAAIAQLDAARTRLGTLEREGERAAAAREAAGDQVETLRARIAELEGEIEARRARVGEADRALDDERDARDRAAADAAQREADQRIAERDDRTAAEDGETARRRLAEIDAELGMLASSFAQNPATAEECAAVEARYANESDEIVDELPRLREELARLANVNLNAEADREELAERERFLRAQLEDLSHARETLLATIREIEASTQVQFNETFDAVAARFAEMFARLFPGGEAKMWQTDPGNLSESGIEIAVQPPGKKMTALPALSGGERAMTAAALIFALVRTRPSPFYLLDEVDAALDDANVERLSAMIREVANEAQLVLVTHNKKTMELASRLFGVTMAEPGASSVISAALDDALVQVPAPEPLLAS